MIQERTKAIPCASDETEDWLAMELEEQSGYRGSAIAWCQAHARPILSLATMALLAVLIAALAFG